MAFADDAGGSNKAECLTLKDVMPCFRCLLCIEMNHNIGAPVIQNVNPQQLCHVE